MVSVAMVLLPFLADTVMTAVPAVVPALITPALVTLTPVSVVVTA